jgi:hypothetical protein
MANNGVDRFVVKIGQLDYFTSIIQSHANKWTGITTLLHAHLGWYFPCFYRGGGGGHFSDFGEKNQSRNQNVAFYTPIWVGSFGLGGVAGNPGRSDPPSKPNTKPTTTTTSHKPKKQPKHEQQHRRHDFGRCSFKEDHLGGWKKG